MKSFSPEEIASVIEGNIINWNNNKKVQRFVGQAVKPLSNCLYFLFKGCEDEDKLLSILVKYNAAGIVIRNSHQLDINKWINAKMGVIEVKSISDAYISSVKFYRSQFNIPFIEVIGSSGKTTTKEMIGAVLKEKMSVLVGFHNYNTPWGVMRNILSLKDHHQAAVVEAGMKRLGIINRSSSIIKPDIGVVTSIHRAHFISLGSVGNIIKAKGELLKHLSKDGILIINGEDENCSKLPLERFKGEILRFGFSDRFDIWASDIRCEGLKTYFKANGEGFEIDCSINTFGRYNVGNALAAIMVGLKVGLSPEEIAKGLSSFKPYPKRLQIVKGIKESIIIDDNFNANPDSTKALLEELPSFTQNRPVILVMGDMERPDDKIEKYAREVHFMIGQQIASLNFYRLIAIGKWAKEYVKGAISKGVPETKVAYFKTVKEAENDLVNSVIPQSVILFKASVYVDLHKLIYVLKN